MLCDLILVKALKLCVDTSGYSAQLFKVAIYEVELVQELALKCSGHLIVHVVELISL